MRGRDHVCGARCIQLWADYRAGKDDGSALISAHRGWIGAFAQDYRVRWRNPDDIEAAGLVGLGKAVATYDPARNDSFQAYARQHIMWAIKSELRRIGGQRGDRPH